MTYFIDIDLIRGFEAQSKRGLRKNPHIFASFPLDSCRFYSWFMIWTFFSVKQILWLGLEFVTISDFMIVMYGYFFPTIIVMFGNRLCLCWLENEISKYQDVQWFKYKQSFSKNKIQQFYWNFGFSKSVIATSTLSK